jgi:hypothetical protein
VFQYDSAGASWGIAFLYPELSGDHMDGMEVVTDPNTGTPYVYVSDMTSDFIGQYRLDPELGWVQENLFSYSGTQGSLLEGMGYGALYHFWATSGNTLAQTAERPRRVHRAAGMSQWWRLWQHARRPWWSPPSRGHRGGDAGRTSGVDDDTAVGATSGSGGSSGAVDVHHWQCRGIVDTGGTEDPPPSAPAA